MYLIDTSVFLEVLLTQDKKEKCKKFLSDNLEELNISDFSLHSIGIILFKNNKEIIFKKFVNDTISKINIITLSKESYDKLTDTKDKFGLDFDDAYQYGVAKEHGLKIVTIDKDFDSISKEIEVVFL